MNRAGKGLPLLCNDLLFYFFNTFWNGVLKGDKHFFDKLLIVVGHTSQVSQVNAFLENFILLLSFSRSAAPFEESEFVVKVFGSEWFRQTIVHPVGQALLNCGSCRISCQGN